MAAQHRTRMDPEERKHLILSIAKDAFAADSYQRVSVAYIATQADVSVALVHKYFDSKSGLFAAVLLETFRELGLRQNDYLQRLSTGASNRDKVTALIEAYLDFIAQLQRPFEAMYVLAGHDDRAANEVRRKAELAQVVRLRAIIQPNDSIRDFYAVQSFPGQLNAIARTWYQRGCLEEEKYPVIDVLVGGLEGALGDWRR